MSKTARMVMNMYRCKPGPGRVHLPADRRLARSESGLRRDEEADGCQKHGSEYDDYADEELYD